MYGLDGNDSLQGSKKNDRIDGGTGKDSLNGYAGTDSYTFAKGDGADSIVDYDWSAGNIDTVQFLDVKSTEITSIKHMEYDRLVLGYGDDQLTVTNYFSEMLYSIDLFKFSDGVTWDRAALLAQNFTFTGTAGNDLISSFSHSEGGNLIYGLGGNDTLTGGAMADSIDGGTGNDTLNGGAGADSMSGGDGSDAYFVDNAADKVIESNATASTGGTDTVYSKLGAYTLTDNVEKGRILASGTANLTGNSLNNTLYAGAGDNVLDGGLGTDLVSYYSATAGVTVSLATTALQATGGSGSDALKNVENLYGSNYADSLAGNTGNNAINAGAGNDILTGGLGADKLTGGTGADRFDFNSLAELGLSSTTRDTIADFKSSEGDRIDLLGVDANTALAGDQTFTFTGTSSAFTGDATAKLRFDAVNHILYGSTDADTAAEFAIALAGVSSLSAADFVL
jgi:Ca2+-binding RTX toxin-like protein